MSEHGRLTRKEAMTGALAGAGALALGAASEAQALDEETALFLGQDLLPVPPKSAKVHTWRASTATSAVATRSTPGRMPTPRSRRPPTGPIP